MANVLHVKDKDGWIRVFCPDTRGLSPEELSNIPLEERKKAEAGDEGMWLEVKCPGEKCMTGDHKITIEVRGVDPAEHEGVWHKLFGPEDRCFADSPSDLP